MLGFDRITFHPRIMAGRACIRGMRIPVSLIVNLVAHGKQPGEIIAEYPDLEPDDIRQALEYASWLSEPDLQAGAIISVSDTVFRVRLLPIR